MNKAVIMDRDGTLIKETHYLSDPKKIKIYKGLIPALKKIRNQGWKLIVCTNQSGIGRGYFTEKVLKKIHDRFRALCKKQNLKIDDILYCPHLPEHKCSCRKPQIGMLKKASRKFKLNLKECIVVGDKISDIDWGLNAGTKTLLVLTGYGKQIAPKIRNKVNHVSSTLAQAKTWILQQGNQNGYKRN